MPLCLKKIGLFTIACFFSFGATAADLSVSEGQKRLKDSVKIVNSWSKDKSAKRKEGYQSDDVVFVSQTITIPPNTVFDGKGKLYVWIGEGNCGQTEGMPPMFKLRQNVTLKNLYMAYAPDGIHIRGSDVTIDNIINLEVCEDALSTSRKDKPKNITVTNSIFINCADKGLQFNSGEHIRVEHNQFLNCRQPIRITWRTNDYVAGDNVMTGVSKKYYLKKAKK